MPKPLIPSNDKSIFMKSCPHCKVSFLISHCWRTDDVRMYDCVMRENMELVNIFNGKRGDTHTCPYCENKFLVL